MRGTARVMSDLPRMRAHDEDLARSTSRVSELTAKSRRSKRQRKNNRDNPYASHTERVPDLQRASVTYVTGNWELGTRN
jgi:hypothetical protein